MKKLKGKPLVALLLIVIVGTVCGTYAYFTRTEMFSNVFKIGMYDMEVSEKFISPDGWTLGTTTEKKVIVKNNGNVDAAVRISYTESWIDENGKELPLVDGNGQKAAIINFASDLDSNWLMKTEDDDITYYYYKNRLSKGASTSSFIESVTFNKDIEIVVSNPVCEESINEDGKIIKICRSTSSGYIGGTYTLDIKVETIQFDQYSDVWGTSVKIN